LWAKNGKNRNQALASTKMGTGIAPSIKTTAASCAITDDFLNWIDGAKTGRA
jgi:hypothetical protein